MEYRTTYPSPVGTLLLSGDEIGLTGLWLEGAKYYAKGLPAQTEEKETPILLEGKRWLECYFSGKKPEFLPPLHLVSSPFRQMIWNLLLKIPYGTVTTYSALAEQAAAKIGCSHMSAQAVGGAVGHNRLSILVPCHRVVGANNSLTGYAGGIQRKLALLELEGVDITQFSIP